MIVVMKPGSTQTTGRACSNWCAKWDSKITSSSEPKRTVVAFIGDDRFKDRTVLETVDGVEKVVPILAPYKMASKEVKKERSIVPLLGRCEDRREEGRRHRRAVQRRK